MAHTLVAARVLVYLLVTTLEKRGPMITLTLESADGISAGQTQVKHRNVSLGVVDEVRLDQDLSHVVVKIRMDAKARPLLTNHARLWVVRPNLSPANLGKALETLVSGAYIEIDPGAPGGRPDHRFVGSTPPRSAPSDEPGRTFVLQTRELGSLSTLSTPKQLAIRVAYDLQPSRLVPVRGSEALSPDRLRSLVGRGLRVALVSGSHRTASLVHRVPPRRQTCQRGGGVGPIGAAERP